MESHGPIARFFGILIGLAGLAALLVTAYLAIAEPQAFSSRRGGGDFMMFGYKIGVREVVIGFLIVFFGLLGALFVWARRRNR